MKIFCLFDKKSCEYSCFSPERNQAMFERSLSAQINNARPNNLLYTNTADFDIYNTFLILRGNTFTTRGNNSTRTGRSGTKSHNFFFEDQNKYL